MIPVPTPPDAIVSVDGGGGQPPAGEYGAQATTSTTNTISLTIGNQVFSIPYSIVGGQLNSMTSIPVNPVTLKFLNFVGLLAKQLTENADHCINSQKSIIGR